MPIRWGCWPRPRASSPRHRRRSRSGSRRRSVAESRSRPAGYSPNHALDPILTGREHLLLQATLQGISKAERKQRADALLERVGLADAADRRVGGYSGGMKRRLDLALALVHQPRILFLDEPTTGLDPASRVTVWDEVRRINERGATVFLTTQYLEEADQLCDRLAIIDDGRIVREGTPASLKAGLRERLGLAREATLDDVFLDATGRARTHVAGEVQEVKA
jgi:ABC-2 type transport system ATP-binding protein